MADPYGNGPSGEQLRRWRDWGGTQRLAPLLWRNWLATQDADDGPGWLQRQATEGIVEQQLAHHWLSHFERLLQQAGLQVILLKGTAFNGWLYPADAPRRSVDIDLLAPARDFDAIEALILKTHRQVLINRQRRMTQRRLFERLYQPRREPGRVVELHRDLTNPGLYRIDHAALWGASRPHPGHPAGVLRILASEHALLNLAVHAARNRCFDDYGLLDAHLLLQRIGPAENGLIETARTWGAATALHLLLEASLRCWPGDETNEKQSEWAALSNALRPGAMRSRLLRRLGNADGRLRQLAWQYALADRMTGVAAFQTGYLMTRIGDLIWSLARRD